MSTQNNPRFETNQRYSNERPNPRRGINYRAWFTILGLAALYTVYTTVPLLLLALVAFGLTVYAAMALSTLSRARKASDRLQPGEVVLYRTRTHAVDVYAAGFYAVFAVLSLALVIWLGPTLSASAPAVPMWGKDGIVERDIGGSLPLGWILLIVPVLFLLVSGYLYADWRRFEYVVTSMRLSEKSHLSPWLPWKGKEDNETPLEQIVEIDSDAGFFGSLLGYGTVIMRKQKMEGGDQTVEVVLRRVPGDEQFVTTVKAAQQARKRALRLEESAATPSSALDTPDAREFFRLGAQVFGRHMNTKPSDPPVASPDTQEIGKVSGPTSPRSTPEDSGGVTS